MKSYQSVPSAILGVAFVVALLGHPGPPVAGELRAVVVPEVFGQGRDGTVVVSLTCSLENTADPPHQLFEVAVRKCSFFKTTPAAQSAHEPPKRSLLKKQKVLKLNDGRYPRKILAAGQNHTCLTHHQEMDVADLYPSGIGNNDVASSPAAAFLCEIGYRAAECAADEHDPSKSQCPTRPNVALPISTSSESATEGIAPENVVLAMLDVDHLQNESGSIRAKYDSSLTLQCTIQEGSPPSTPSQESDYPAWPSTQSGEGGDPCVWKHQSLNSRGNPKFLPEDNERILGRNARISTPVNLPSEDEEPPRRDYTSSLDPETGVRTCILNITEVRIEDAGHWSCTPYASNSGKIFYPSSPVSVEVVDACSTDEDCPRADEGCALDISPKVCRHVCETPGGRQSCHDHPGNSGCDSGAELALFRIPHRPICACSEGYVRHTDEDRNVTTCVKQCTANGECNSTEACVLPSASTSTPQRDDDDLKSVQQHTNNSLAPSSESDGTCQAVCSVSPCPQGSRCEADNHERICACEHGWYRRPIPGEVRTERSKGTPAGSDKRQEMAKTSSDVTPLPLCEKPTFGGMLIHANKEKDPVCMVNSTQARWVEGSRCMEKDLKVSHGFSLMLKCTAAKMFPAPTSLVWSFQGEESSNVSSNGSSPTPPAPTNALMTEAVLMPSDGDNYEVIHDLTPVSVSGKYCCAANSDEGVFKICLKLVVAAPGGTAAAGVTAESKPSWVATVIGALGAISAVMILVAILWCINRKQQVPDKADKAEGWVYDDHAPRNSSHALVNPRPSEGDEDAAENSDAGLDNRGHRKSLASSSGSQAFEDAAASADDEEEDSTGEPVVVIDTETATVQIHNSPTDDDDDGDCEV